MKSFAKLAELDRDYKVYPGHERATTLNREKESNYYFIGADYDSIY